MVGDVGGGEEASNWVCRGGEVHRGPEDKVRCGVGGVVEVAMCGVVAYFVMVCVDRRSLGGGWWRGVMCCIWGWWGWGCEYGVFLGRVCGCYGRFQFFGSACVEGKILLHIFCVGYLGV